MACDAGQIPNVFERQGLFEKSGNIILYFEAIAGFIRVIALLKANCSLFTSSKLRGSKFGHSIAGGPFHIAAPLIVLSHFQHPLRSLEVAYLSDTAAH